MERMNHYLLPDGNVQVAFSGGRTSAYLLRQSLTPTAGCQIALL